MEQDIQTPQAPKAQPLRKDPVLRATDGITPWTVLKNRSDDRHYVWVGTAAQEYGVEFYRTIGYEVVENTPDGPRLAAGTTSKPGSPLEYRGHVLMACTAERRAEIEDDGAYGGGGQRSFDAIEKRIVTSRSGEDGMRGISNAKNKRYWTIQNQTGAAQFVTGELAGG